MADTHSADLAYAIRMTADLLTGVQKDFDPQTFPFTV